MERAWTIPAGDGLSLITFACKTGHMRVDDGSLNAVQRKSSPRFAQPGGVYITAVKNNVMGKLGIRRVTRASQINKIVDVFRTGIWREFDPNKTEVMRLLIGADRRGLVRRKYL